jgi:uncharacterized protein YabN with tetrapyrrole methylase and pyrophosphatase domain
MATTGPESSQSPSGHPTPLGESFLRLVAIVERLRSEQGCPWDRQQTPSSLIPYMLEETYEVIESIEADDHHALKEELGDVLLHIVFQSRIAEEQQQFTLVESIQTVVDKLIRRHPHVFSDVRVQDTAEIRQRWESAKQREKGRESLLDGVPRTLPALTRARRVQEKAPQWGSIGLRLLLCGRKSTKSLKNCVWPTRRMTLRPLPRSSVMSCSAL